MKRALAALLFAASSTIVCAETWPSHPVKIVSPFAAGGPTDTLARPVADHLSKAFGQPFTIENRAGAGSTLGAQYVAKSEPDGYTLLFGTNSAFAIGPVVYARAGYGLDSFQPVVLVAETPMVLSVSNKSGITSMAELVDAARKTPAGFSYASVGVGTSTHMLGERLNQIAGLKMAHVPYRGSAPAMNDLVVGQVQLFFDTASSTRPLAESGSIRIIAVLQGERTPLLPNVPSVAEAGFPQFSGMWWGGIGAPAGTPQAIVERINAEVNAMLKTAEFRQLLDKLAYSPVGGAPAVLKDRTHQEAAIWKEVADRAGIRVE